jgi:hypothetical protein
MDWRGLIGAQCLDRADASAERHAHTTFARASADDVGDHSVDADGYNNSATSAPLARIAATQRRTC